MKDKTKNQALVTVSFIWVGLILAISFMESWVKFKSELVDLKIGVSVGREVFGMLNNIEVVLAIIWGYLCWQMYRTKWFLVVVLMVLVQTVYLLPMLSKRVDLIINGEIPEGSMLHFSYVVFEVVKLVVIFCVGVKRLNNIN